MVYFIVSAVGILLDFALMMYVFFKSSSNTNHINNKANARLEDMFIKAQLPNFDKEAFYNEAFKIYKDVQIAWMDNDIERVRNVLSDEMFNTYKMQLETLKIKNQKNIMEDITLKDVYITDIKTVNEKKVIDVIMHVNCRDYIIDITNNKVLRGKKNKVWFYEYCLSYMKDSGESIDHCPNCSAKLKDGSSVKCEYCGSIINRKADKFILIDKKMISQR